MTNLNQMTKKESNRNFKNFKNAVKVWNSDLAKAEKENERINKILDALKGTN